MAQKKAAAATSGKSAKKENPKADSKTVVKKPSAKQEITKGDTEEPKKKTDSSKTAATATSAKSKETENVTPNRYSDKDLLEFEELIKSKLVQAKSDLDELRQSLSHEGDNSTDDTSPTFKMMEDGSDTMTREEVAQLASRQEKFIQALENALLRIKNKTYGICRVTGKLIPKERLRLVPHATLSIEAKNMQ